MVIGPVASGKSTLCKTLLGEIPTAQGDVIVNVEKIGYCDQVPFLLNATVKDNIIGFSSFDAARYGEVIEAVMLQEDLKNLPQADSTKVGSKGVSLSGRQKQRVSLARALYHDAELLVLDDVFGGLDGDTQDQVCQRVFGQNGLLRRRGTTVVLCTHSVDLLLPVADHVIEIGANDSITKRGSVEVLKADDRHAREFSPIPSFKIKAGDNARSTDDQVQIQKPTDKPARVAPTELAVHRHYASRIGLLPLLLFAGLAAGFGFFRNFPTIWMTYWSEDSAKAGQSHGFSFYIGIYALLAAGALMCVFPAGLVVLRTMSGSQVLVSTEKPSTR